MHDAWLEQRVYDSWKQLKLSCDMWIAGLVRSMTSLFWGAWFVTPVKMVVKISLVITDIYGTSDKNRKVLVFIFFLWQRWSVVLYNINCKNLTCVSVSFQIETESLMCFQDLSCTALARRNCLCSKPIGKETLYILTDQLNYKLFSVMIYKWFVIWRKIHFVGLWLGPPFATLYKGDLHPVDASYLYQLQCSPIL